LPCGEAAAGADRLHRSHRQVYAIMPRRAYLVFDDFEGKLDVLRVECTQMRSQGPLPGSQAHREIRPQGKHDEMEGTAKRRLPEARCT